MFFIFYYNFSLLLHLLLTGIKKMFTEKKPTQSKTPAPSHQSEVQYKYIGIEDVFFTIIVPLSVHKLHIRERTKTNAY